MLPSFSVIIIKQNKTEKNKTQKFQSDTHFWRQETWMKDHHKLSSCTNTKRENTRKGEKNTMSAPQCSTAVRQSVKMGSLSTSTLMSNQTLTLLKICKKRAQNIKKREKKHTNPRNKMCYLILHSPIVISPYSLISSAQKYGEGT